MVCCEEEHPVESVAEGRRLEEGRKTQLQQRQIAKMMDNFDQLTLNGN